MPRRNTRGLQLNYYGERAYTWTFDARGKKTWQWVGSEKPQGDQPNGCLSNPRGNAWNKGGDNRGNKGNQGDGDAPKGQSGPDKSVGVDGKPSDPSAPEAAARLALQNAHGDVQRFRSRDLEEEAIRAEARVKAAQEKLDSLVPPDRKLQSLTDRLLSLDKKLADSEETIKKTREALIDADAAFEQAIQAKAETEEIREKWSKTPGRCKFNNCVRSQRWKSRRCSRCFLRMGHAINTAAARGPGTAEVSAALAQLSFLQDLATMVTWFATSHPHLLPLPPGSSGACAAALPKPFGPAAALCAQPSKPPEKKEDEKKEERVGSEQSGSGP